jgi:hypothetical protein
MDFLFSVQDIYRESGPRAATESFARQVMVGMEDEGVPRQTPEEHNVVNQLDNEWPWPGISCPDLQVRRAGMHGMRKPPLCRLRDLDVSEWSFPAIIKDSRRKPEHSVLF